MPSLPDLELIVFQNDELKINMLDKIQLTTSQEDPTTSPLEKTGEYSWNYTLPITTDDTLYLTFFMANNGETETTASFRTSVLIDNSTSIFSLQNQFMKPGSISYQRFLDLGRFETGSHRLVLTIDHDNSITESNEENNVYTLTFDVTPGAEKLKPDLCLYTLDNENVHLKDVMQLTSQKDVWASSSQLVADELKENTWRYCGDTLTTDDELFLTFATLNQGDTAINDDFYISVTIDGIKSKLITVTEEIAKNVCVISEYVYLGNLDEGDHTIVVQLDANNDIDEIDENNEYTLDITIEKGTTTPAEYLLDSLWEQNGDGKYIYEYNKYLPNDTLTGCISTAFGQVLYYWAQQGYDISLELTEDDFLTYTIFNENMKEVISSTKINAANMQEYCGLSLTELNGLLENITFDEANWDTDDDIAALGVAIPLIQHASAQEIRTTTPSGVATSYITSAKISEDPFQRADFNATFLNNISETDFATFQENIAQGKPIVISCLELAHAVVLDGYNATTNMYHLNFGWGQTSQKQIEAQFDYQLAGTGWYTIEEISNLSPGATLVNIMPNFGKSCTYGSSVISYSPQGATSAVLSFSDKDVVIPMAFHAHELKVNLLGTTEKTTLQFYDGNIPVSHDFTVSISIPEDNAPLKMIAKDDNVKDVFLARSQGVWNNRFAAQHTGYTLDGTHAVCAVTSLEQVLLGGKNKICDVFCANENDANVLLLSDDDNGDALFVDDAFSDSGNTNKQLARLEQIKEIYAGAGNDIVDLTSSRIVYSGGGIIAHGGDGNDCIWANHGNNVLFGDAGDDSLVGSDCDDIFIGGTGMDKMYGNGGNDVFCFGKNWGEDYIVQSSGNVILAFADGIEYTASPDGKNYSYNGNTITIECSGSIQVSTDEKYLAYCNQQNSSSTICLAS